MKNIEKLARFLETKQHPDKVLEVLLQLPLGGRKDRELSEAQLAAAIGEKLRET